jgi:hypothetical protein
MSSLRWLFRRHPILSSAFALAVALALFFAIRLAVATLVWSHPPIADQQPEGWMTPRYIAHSWQVPPDIVAEALAVDRDGAGRRITLNMIAKSTNQSVDELAVKLTAAIAEYRKSFE